MKGIIFNLVEEVLTATQGADAWDDLLDAAGLDGTYTSLGNYPDADFFRLVGAAAAANATPADDIVRTLGSGAMPLLRTRYPVFFEGHTSTRSFLLTLNNIIHAEVRKLYPGAVIPQFEFDDSDPTTFVLGYQSDRKLCALAEGFIIGAAEQFGERASVVQTACMLRGDPTCRLSCTFESVA